MFKFAKYVSKKRREAGKGGEQQNTSLNKERQQHNKIIQGGRLYV